MNKIFKPKDKDFIINTNIYKKVDVYMNEIFSDLHKDNVNPNIYRNSNFEKIFTIYDKVILFDYIIFWSYFDDELQLTYRTTKALINFWLKENTKFDILSVDYID